MELWSICHWPVYLHIFYVHFLFHSLFLLLSFLLTPWVSYYNFSHIPAYFFSVNFLLCFVSLHTLLSPLVGILLLSLCLLHICFVVPHLWNQKQMFHLIKSNSLIINSCLHQLRHIDRGLAQQVAYLASDFRKPSQSSRWKLLIINSCWRQPGREVAEIVRSA